MTENLHIQALKEGDACPKCGSPLVIRHSNHGDFLGCSDYPLCNFIKPIASTHSIEILGEVGANCPSCGHKLLVKKGRYGIFIGCSNYPECSFIHNPQGSLDISCPLCKKGKLAQRPSSSGRRFYACSNYPECKFSTPGRPHQKNCQECGFPLMFEKKFKKGLGLVCANTLCASRKKRKFIPVESTE